MQTNMAKSGFWDWAGRAWNMKSAFRYSFCWLVQDQRTQEPNLLPAYSLLLKTRITTLETVNTEIQPAVPNQNFMLATNFSQITVDLSRHQKVLSQIDILISVNLLINKILVPGPISLKVERQNQNDDMTPYRRQPTIAKQTDRQKYIHTEPNLCRMYITDINPFHAFCNFITVTSCKHTIVQPHVSTRSVW